MKNSINKLNVGEFYRLCKKQLLLEDLSTGSENTNPIRGWKIHLAKYGSEDILPGNIYLLTENNFSELSFLSRNQQDEFCKLLINSSIPCLIVEKNINKDSRLLKTIGEKLPVFRTTLKRDDLEYFAEKTLRDKLTPFSTVHGVLIDIHRLGVLILGKSGVGKSESALDLVNRGSKLIADDVIEVRKYGSRLIGTGPENIRHLMEIRGVGIVNIKDLYGASSVMNERQIDLVIELDHWDQQKEYDRLGLDTYTYKFMEVEIPYMLIPVSPGRNTATIIDVAVRNQLLKVNRYYDETSDKLKSDMDKGIDI